MVYKGFLEQGNDGYPQLVAVKALKGRLLYLNVFISITAAKAVSSSLSQIFLSICLSAHTDQILTVI